MGGPNLDAGSERRGRGGAAGGGGGADGVVVVLAVERINSPSHLRYGVRCWCGMLLAWQGECGGCGGCYPSSSSRQRDKDVVS